MGWLDSLFGRTLQPASEIFTGFRRKLLAPRDSNLLKRARKKLEQVDIGRVRSPG